MKCAISRLFHLKSLLYLCWKMQSPLPIVDLQYWRAHEHYRTIQESSSSKSPTLSLMKPSLGHHLGLYKWFGRLCSLVWPSMIFEQLLMWLDWYWLVLLNINVNEDKICGGFVKDIFIFLINQVHLYVLDTVPSCIVAEIP